MSAYHSNIALHIVEASAKAHRRLDKQKGDTTLGWLAALAIVAAVVILVVA